MSKRRPIGFHAVNLFCQIDLFDLILNHRWLCWTAPLWLPVYLMVYIYYYMLTETIPKLLRLRRVFR